MTPFTPPEYVPVAVKVCGGPPGARTTLDGATVNEVSARKVAVTAASPFSVKVQVAPVPHTDASPLPDEYPVNRAVAPASARISIDDPWRYVAVQEPERHASPSSQIAPVPSPASVVVSVAIGPSPSMLVSVTAASAVIVKLQVLSAHP